MVRKKRYKLDCKPFVWARLVFWAFMGRALLDRKVHLTRLVSSTRRPHEATNDAHLSMTSSLFLTSDRSCPTLPHLLAVELSRCAHLLAVEPPRHSLTTTAKTPAATPSLQPGKGDLIYSHFLTTVRATWSTVISWESLKLAHGLNWKLKWVRAAAPDASCIPRHA